MVAESKQVIIPNSLELTKAFVIINTNNIVKLTSTNYLSWKLQVEALIIGYDLYKFIYGSNPSPPSTILINNVKSSNPEFQSWLRQDKLIFGALIRSLTPSLIPLISQSLTSNDAWGVLANTYVRPSQGHIKQIKEQNKLITKGTKPISEYM